VCHGFEQISLKLILHFQVCEPTGATYAVRREYYPHTSPAGKGAKWEWAGDGQDPEWHIYDMEVQTVIEDAWTVGKQVSIHFKLLSASQKVYSEYVISNPWCWHLLLL